LRIGDLGKSEMRKAEKLERTASKSVFGVRILDGGVLVVEDDSGLVQAMACDPSRRLSFRSETNLQKSRGEDRICPRGEASMRA